MYIQITNRCNMHCAHCMLNCTAVGQDMKFGVFVEILKLFEPYLEHHKCRLTIGGGEPSLHPLLAEFVEAAFFYTNNVGMKTNGTNYDKLSKLLHRLRRRISWVKEDLKMSISVSYDDYHDRSMQDPRFLSDRRFGKVEGYTILRAGRGWGLPVDKTIGVTYCLGNGHPFITPDGRIYSCWCDSKREVSFNVVREMFSQGCFERKVWECSMGAIDEEDAQELRFFETKKLQTTT